ncbi:MAG: bacterial transcriptional activator domain-containing protein [Aggregatilineales bacterium]
MSISLQSIAVEQLHNLPDQVRLIAVHPNYASQHLILAEFLDTDAVYIRFNGKKLSRDDLMEQLKTSLQEQINSTDPADAKFLILDEVDRAKLPELDKFLPMLIEILGDSRAILLSRQIPQSFISHAKLAGKTSFIPTSDAFMLSDYTNRQTDSILLEVRSFGEGRVLLNGKEVNNWDGVLPRALFFYLVDRGMVTRNEIFDTFWPNLTVREATNVFHVTKRKISEVLGIDLTAYWSGFYRISPDIELSYDVISFTDTVQRSGIANDGDAMDLLEQADQLYGGDFLNGMTMPWVLNRRVELAQDYGEALAGLAKAKEDAGHHREALGLYLRAAANNRNREDIITSIMNLYHELGMHADALIAYERLTEGLRLDLGVLPAPHIQALATSIRHEMEQAS